MTSLIPFGGGTNLSKQSQNAMKTLEEKDMEDVSFSSASPPMKGVANNKGKKNGSVLDGRSDSGGSDEAGSSCFSSTDNVQSSSSSSSFKLAVMETLMISYSKVVLLVVIAAFAAAATAVTYRLIKGQERSEYHAAFHDITNELKEFSQLKKKHVLDHLERFGVSLTSYAMDQDLKWPFVVFPDFQVRGILNNEATGAHTLSVNPLVFAKDLEAWSEFAVSNQEWMEEAHVYDRTVHEELYEVENFTSTYEHDPTVHWTVTGVSPYVWAIDPNDRYARPRVGNAPLYTPIWQRAPPCDYATQVNSDLRSDPVFTNFIDGMLAVDHPVITKVVDATYLETNYESRFDQMEQAEPHSYLLSPVYDNLSTNRTAVAFLSAFLRWGAFFEDVLPSSEEGIYVVLESDCGQVHTYEIFGHKPVYIGEGNLHETDVDDDPIDLRFEFSPKLALESEDGKYTFCHYYAHIYPSVIWREKHFSNKPYVYAATVLTCFLVTAAGFILYDILVQRRQKKVMTSAAKTNAIVTSLFPENVRDRLLEEAAGAEDENGGLAKKNPLFGSSNAAYRNDGTKKGTESTSLGSEAIFGSKPIADLFPETTIMFCDMVGFTAWSSTREPHQVFTLLETVYHSFDTVAKRRRVFKVETVGDCYVAVAGLPQPQERHAVIMAKFANDCLQNIKKLVHRLETTLGPDTADLNIRIGLHSGPVTAGVLRGDKGRFQLFGDTMNTAARLESTGCAGKIHVSRETAELLIAAGRSKWVTQREDHVIAKGKGEMQTFWVRIQSESHNTGSNMTNSSYMSDGLYPSTKQGELEKALTLGPAARRETNSEPSAMKSLTPKECRLVKWNAEMLAGVLKQVMARRETLGNNARMAAKRQSKKITAKEGNVLDEVKDVLALPQFDVNTFQNQVDPQSINISTRVLEQLTDMVARIAASYQDNPFHSFEHASHVTMSVTKLLSRIVNPNELKTKGTTDDKVAADLHDHTFGITSDPLTQFACILSALIHDADHPGVPNSTLVKEEDPLAVKYNNKSVAEQNSVDLAWDIIMSEEYKDLQSCIYSNQEEFERFRSIVVNVVMATDIMDKDLGAQRKARWEKAFAQESEEEAKTPLAINRKATIVLEHLMQASDVSHTMQHWVVFQKWNERLFKEMYKAYVEGRSDRDPSEGWYQGELGFFDYYIIPLAKKLETCGVFGVSSHEYLSYAQANRREWEAKGEKLVKDYVNRFHNENSGNTANA